MAQAQTPDPYKSKGLEGLSLNPVPARPLALTFTLSDKSLEFLKLVKPQIQGTLSSPLRSIFLSLTWLESTNC